MAAGTELIQVPTGEAASLYLTQAGSDENSWVTLVQPGQGGRWLIHLETGLESDSGTTQVQGLGTDAPVVGVNFFLPDAANTQEIVKQVKELLGQSGGLGLGQNWSKARVVILNASSPDGAEALLAVPPQGMQGQMIWPGGGGFGGFSARRTSYTAVRVQRVQFTSGFGSVAPAGKVMSVGQS